MEKPLTKKRKTQYKLFVGKGGVGKTSCAAATALRLSKQGHKTLIVSTDPAHSLADSFKKKIGPEEKKIFDNLWAVEIDPAKDMEKMQDEMRAGVKKMEDDGQKNPLAQMMPGLDMENLISGFGDFSSLPGMDEVTAFQKFLDYIDNNDYDYIIFDTAPTGHTLRFLSLPEIMDSWVGKMLKFRYGIAGMADIFKKLIPFTQPQDETRDKSLEKLEEMKAQIEKGRLILTNPNQTEFVMIMIPQDMSIFESESAVKSLETHGIKVNRAIVNQFQPSHKDCSFCSTRHDQHNVKLKDIKKKFPKVELHKVNLFKHEIRGEKELIKLADTIYS